jgi:GNAT superfamily N-acetyltransferase
VIVVRSWTTADLPGLTELSAALGYPLETAELQARIALLDDDDLLVVAELDGVVAGFVAARHDDHLAEGPAVEVSAIVVDPAVHRRGVAGALMAAVEDWAGARGRAVIRLRANVVRDGAHRFYRARGFEAVKRSTVFEKRIG